MTALVFEFIHKCDSLGVYPDESHITCFLTKVNKLEYKDNFIRFCFYHWGHRHDQKIVINILKDIG